MLDRENVAFGLSLRNDQLEMAANINPGLENVQLEMSSRLLQGQLDCENIANRSRPNNFSVFHFNVVGNWIVKAWLSDPGLINVQFEMSSMLLQG